MFVLRLLFTPGLAAGLGIGALAEQTRRALGLKNDGMFIFGN